MPRSRLRRVNKWKNYAIAGLHLDVTMHWLAEHDPDYGQMGEDVYGDVYGISTRRKANKRRKHERSLTPDLVDRERDDYYHCAACRRKAYIESHTSS